MKTVSNTYSSLRFLFKEFAIMLSIMILWLLRINIFSELGKIELILPMVNQTVSQMESFVDAKLK